jgi:general secretion pathway protein A
MYESFYGLKEKPFNQTPDPDYLYMSSIHENVYAHIEYAIEESKGFVVVTGEVGSGKTTLINYLLRKISQNIHVGIINNTFMQPQELLRMICQEYELPYEDVEKTALLARFSDYLLEQYAKRERVILIIDEAQNLPERSLEEIRMLSNLEAEKHHLIQIVLVGQPQLKEKLKKKSLEQFYQRVTVYCHLEALDQMQVDSYIRHRLTVAGAQNLELFDRGALTAIYQYSLGIPRLINMLCDAALVYGYADDVNVIGRDLIEAVAKARSLEVKETERDLFPEEAEKQGVAVLGSAALRLDEFERQIQTLGERLTSQGNEILKISQGLSDLNGHKGSRDKIILALFNMLRRNLQTRAKLMQENITLKERLGNNKRIKKKLSAAKTAALPLQDKTYANDSDQ